MKTTFVDIQIWMGTCYDNDGSIHLVHSEDYFMEASRSSSFFLDRRRIVFNRHLVSLLLKNRAQFRREANQADNKAATVAVDSLINFEAVKVRK